FKCDWSSDVCSSDLKLVHQRKVTFEKIENEYLIRVMCIWERSIAPSGPTGRYHLTQVTDDTGASLLPAERAPLPPRPALMVRSVDRKSVGEGRGGSA